MKKNGFLIIVIVLCIASLFINFDNVNYYTYVSYTDGSNRAIVEKVKLSEKQIIKKYKKYKYVKIDNIASISDMTKADLSFYISSSNDNTFMFGITFPDYDITLLSEEINANALIDYENDTLNFENINNYLKDKGIETTINDNDNIEIITTNSKYLKNDEFIELTPINGFHQKKYNQDEIQNIIDNASLRLVSMIKQDGSYIYGMNASTGREYTSYNILRHAGSTWSLIKYYETNPSQDLKNKIDLAIDYLINNYLVVYSENTNYIIEKKANEIKLGGNALTLLMLSEYQKVFSDNKYESIAKKIAHGIIKMQNEDGSYNHILNIDFEVTEKFRTVFYDGEATYALLSFYEITSDEQYLNAAKKAIDYFIKNDYTKHRDHWVEYSMITYLKYNNDSKYIYFALDNYINNKDALNDTNTFSPTRLELIIQALNTYNKYANDDKELYDSLIKAANYNVDILLNYYIDEWIAMYYENPDKVIYGFHYPSDDFQMRIDDIQHSILGLMEYNKLKIKA